MNLTPFELALIAGGFTIVGVLIGSVLGRRNALAIYKVSEFNKSANRFRSAFLPETTYLKHNANIGGLGHASELHEKLRSRYLHHLKALETFKVHLSAADREAIDHAWDEYCHPQGVPQDPNERRSFVFNDYMSIADSEGAEKAKEIASQHIEKILEFGNFR